MEVEGISKIILILLFVKGEVEVICPVVKGETEAICPVSRSKF